MEATLQLAALQDALEKQAGIGSLFRYIPRAAKALVKYPVAGYMKAENALANGARYLTKGIFNKALSSGGGQPGVVERLSRLAVRNPNSRTKAVEIGRDWADNAFFRWKPKDIYLGENLKDAPFVLAHEIGHSQKATSKLGRWATYRFLKHMRKMQQAARAGTLSPMSASAKDMEMLMYYAPEEFRASLAGYNYLRHMGLGRLQSLKAFAGLPSYVLPASARLYARRGLLMGGGYGAYKGYKALTDDE